MNPILLANVIAGNEPQYVKNMFLYTEEESFLIH